MSRQRAPGQPRVAGRETGTSLASCVISLALALPFFSAIAQAGETHLEVNGEDILLDGKVTRIIGLRCSNALMSNATTDDLIAALDVYRAYGINTITVYVMGSRFGDVKGYLPDGSLNPVYRDRLERILRATDERGMITIVGCLYWSTSGAREDLGSWTQTDANRAVGNTARWLARGEFDHVILDPDNEGMALRAMGWRVESLIRAAKAANPDLVVANNTHERPPNEDLNMHFGKAEEGKPWFDSEGTPATAPGGYWGRFSKETHRADPEYYNYSRIGRYTAEMKADQLERTRDAMRRHNGYVLASTWLQCGPAEGVHGPFTRLGGSSDLGSGDDESAAWNRDIDTLHPDAGIRWWMEFVRDNYGPGDPADEAGAVRSATTGPSPDAVFQYALALETTREREARAHLWLPPRSESIRGVILCGTTLMEPQFVRDGRIREACRGEDLALVILSCGLGQVDVEALLEDLARSSSYEELRDAPLFFVGHSAGGPPARALAVKFARRCFGLIQYRGGVPSVGSPIPPGIPTLAMVGQFDEFGGTMRGDDGVENWEGGVTALGEFRQLGADRLAALVVEPGAGHFAWSDRNAALAAMFIRKAAAAIPTHWKPGPAELRRPDPESGWLTSLSPKAGIECAAFGDFEGDLRLTSWHFDEEMARATVQYHRGLVGRKDQFIGWKNRHWVDAGARFFFLGLEWEQDGQSFEVQPVYSDVYPSQHGGRGPVWPRAGQPVGNCGKPIHLKAVGGPLVAVGSSHFRIRHDALVPAGGRIRGTFMAYSEGDEEYRYTEHVGMMPRGFRGLERGREQTITFPPVPDIAVADGGIDLKAVSDCDLDVEYYVARGPAVVVGSRLVIRDLPRRAGFPIEVEVVAWQFGSGVEPPVRTAPPVSRTLGITNSRSTDE